MDFHIITIFPEWFLSSLNYSIIKRAADKSIIRFFIHNLRDWAHDRHRTVDDIPFGGGAGMVMKVEPLAKAIENIKNSYQIDKTILMSPAGISFNQKIAKELSKKRSIIIICGNYEGVDERIITGGFVDMELSIGDFILTGGEIAAFSVIDAVTRLLPDALGNEDSLKEESFENELLEYPHYTRPRNFRGMKVPEELLSGNHEKIRIFRRKESLLRTYDKRPDLFSKQKLSDKDKKLIDLKSLDKNNDLGIFIALVHYPVLSRHGDEITTAVTTVDIHDIARSSRTYGVKKLFIITPIRAQQELVQRVIDHWVRENGSQFDHPRKEAVLLVEILDSFENLKKRIHELTGSEGIYVATGARLKKDVLSFSELKKLIHEGNNPVTILFGTGWGLAPCVINKADFKLEAIMGSSDYNHLSVRSAASIILDRLLGG